MQEITIDATLENIYTVTDFVDRVLEEALCPMKVQMQIDIALDELFSNIARYAYSPNVGKATVQIEIIDNPKGAKITFIDEGIPYDPLAKKDPDITLSAEERSIGGLGIYMVKKSMDEMTYKREDNKNILSIVRYFA